MLLDLLVANSANATQQLRNTCSVCCEGGGVSMRRRDKYVSVNKMLTGAKLAVEQSVPTAAVLHWILARLVPGHPDPWSLGSPSPSSNK